MAAAQRKKEFGEKIRFLCAIFNIADPTHHPHFESLTPLRQAQHLNRAVMYMKKEEKRRFHYHLDKIFLETLHDISYKGENFICMTANEKHPISILNQISQKEGCPRLSFKVNSMGYIEASFRGIQIANGLRNAGPIKDIKAKLAKHILNAYPHIKINEDIKAYILENPPIPRELYYNNDE